MQSSKMSRTNKIFSSYYIVVLGIFNATFIAETPMKIGWSVLEIQAVDGFVFVNRKLNRKFVLLTGYNLEVNIREFQFILLDHITYAIQECNKVSWRCTT